MDITMTPPRSHDTKQLSGLHTLAAGALFGFAFMYVYIQAVLIGHIEMPLPILSAVSLGLALLVAGRPVGGWRWTPLLATAWSLVLLFAKLELVLYQLAHPEHTLEFATQLVMLSLVVVSVVAGVGGTVQNYRLGAGKRGMPRWVRWGFTALASLFIGAVAVAAIPQAGSGIQVSPAALAQLAPVTLDAFKGGEIRVKAGELTALRLENTDASAHSFDIDALDVHVAMPGSGESLALFTAETPGTYTFYCAPHYNKSTGTGMHGTLIVEP